MDSSGFGKTAVSLIRNPLGIIALFIVLIYGIAGLVFSLSSTNLEAPQRWPLIWFLVIFPVVVFVAFVWLVARHSPKLYGPSDFRNDETFINLTREVSETMVRQKAHEVDPRVDIDPAITVMNELLESHLFDTAVYLLKGFLKVKRYRISLKLIAKIEDEARDYYGTDIAFVQYRAYSMIGLEHYQDAIPILDRLKATEEQEYFDFWPKLAYAYCLKQLGKEEEFESAIQEALSIRDATDIADTISHFYPDLGDYIPTKE